MTDKTLDEARREFPEWDMRQDICGLLYASKGEQRVRGEDPTDLRDEIIRSIWGAWEA